MIAAARRQYEQIRTGSSAHAGLDPARTDPPGANLHRYTLIRELHRGSQGVVYLAEQRSPRRQVAVKMVREGPLASHGEQVRFQREIEALGALHHPNIVAIHDTGIDAGHLYYVMDFVDGPTLDAYIRPRRAQATAARSRVAFRRYLDEMLRIFAKISDAVQAAHLRGIIHRDLKPSNIRVDARGEPHILDFGLAKSIHVGAGLPAQADLTQTGEFLGTLAYASPEQLDGACDDLDIRTDVYSLGVILYELVAGVPPYPVTGALSDIMDSIRRAQPRRPSMWVDVRHDLDTILLKALSKSKDRRYQSAGALGADLRRYLDDKPIEARRDSALYMLRMFGRRHRAAALVTLAFVVLLGASSATLAYMYTRQTRLREAAEANEQKARDNATVANERAEHIQQIAQFQATRLSSIDVQMMGIRLRQELLDNVRQAALTAGAAKDAADRRVAEMAERLAGVNFTAFALQALSESVFRRTAEAINQQFEQQPVVRAELLQTLADTLRDLGLLEQAMAPQVEALEIRRRGLGDDHPHTLTSVSKIGQLLEAMGRYEEAMPYCQEALEGRRAVLGDDHQDTAAAFKSMGGLLFHAGRRDEAVAYLQDALAANQRLLGDEHPQTLSSMNDLAYVLQSMGRYDEAEMYYRRALGTRRRVLGDDHPQTLNSINNMAFLLKTMGQLEHAREFYEEALEGRLRVLGKEHPSTLESIGSMGTLLQTMGKLDEAVKYFHEALDAQRRILGSDHPETLITLNNIGQLAHSTGRLDEALPYYQEALDGFRRTLGPEHPNTLTLIGNMASLLRMLGRTDEAFPYFRDALDSCRRVLGDEDPKTLIAMLKMGRLLKVQGRLEEALPYYQEALDTSRRVLPEAHPVRLASLNYMGSLLEAMGQPEEALRYCDEVLVKRRRTLGDQHHHTLASINQRGVLLRKLGRWQESEQYLHEAAAGAEKLPPGIGLYPEVVQNLIELYEAWHAAAPDANREESATHWRARLDGLQSETAPAVEP